MEDKMEMQDQEQNLNSQQESQQANQQVDQQESQQENDGIIISSPEDEIKKLTGETEESKDVEEQSGEKEKVDVSEKENATTEQPKRKSRAQKRIEQLIRQKHELLRELEKLKNAQTKEEKEEAQRNVEEKAQEHQEALGVDLDPDAFDSFDEYLEALSEQQNAEIMKEKASDEGETNELEEPEVEDEKNSSEIDGAQDLQEVVEILNAKFDTAREVYSDFDAKLSDPTLPLTKEMLEAMANIDNAGDVAYYLASHKDEATRIAKLPPVRQIAEIGKLEYAVASKKVEVEAKVSKAPEPVKPTRANAMPEADIESMSFKEYEQWRQQQRSSKGFW